MIGKKTWRAIALWIGIGGGMGLCGLAQPSAHLPCLQETDSIRSYTLCTAQPTHHIAGSVDTIVNSCDTAQPSPNWQYSCHKETADSLPYHPISLSHAFVYGKVGRFNSYLSPLKYTGSSWGYRWEMQHLLLQKQPRWWVSHRIEGAYERLTSSAQTALTSNYALLYETNCYYLIRLPHRVQCGIGAGWHLGGVYMEQSRNQNNPQDLMACADLQGSALAAYELHVNQFACRFSLNTQLSLMGWGFSPRYRESYWQAVLLEGFLKRVSWHALHNRVRCHVGLKIELPVWRISTLYLAYNYTTDSRTISGLHRSAQMHYWGIGLSTDLRPYPGYRAIRNRSVSHALFL